MGACRSHFQGTFYILLTQYIFKVQFRDSILGGIPRRFLRQLTLAVQRFRQFPDIADAINRRATG